ncbi:phage tail protein [Methylobacter marinus]|uniref:phage tail protein n=1 Tax=Methylobacter marinus TaxID=34058 RepID=UPI0003779108|nr:phage tail protein [Methylobacter marinus]
MSKGSSTIAGYYYYLGWQAALCHGPIDAVTRIVFADRTAWSGAAMDTEIAIDQPGLFGGESKEGGVSGQVSILSGKATQTQDSYLAGVLGEASIPAFRGVCTLLFKSFYYALHNPYMKAMAIQAQRTNIDSQGAPMWYLAKARIGDDMNPAHGIRELYTDRNWGMGLAASLIDEASFMAAADTLYNEGNGFSLIWEQAQSIDDLINMVLVQIDGVIRTDIATGKIQIKLVRDDYSVNDLLSISENNVIAFESFQRSGWEDTINEVALIYHDEGTDQDKPVIVHDIGNQQIQGRRISKTLQMPGISNATLAQKVAQRELRVSSTPLSAIRLKCNRTVWGLNKGDVFKFSWNKYGIADVVYRIGDIDFGTINDSAIIITAVEDVFAFPASVYYTPIDSLWADSPSAPVAATYQRVYEATYWDSVFNLSAADHAQLGANFAFVAACAVKPKSDFFGFDLQTRVGAAAYAPAGSGQFCPTATVTAALGLAVSNAAIAIANGYNLDQVAVGRYALLDDELVAVTTIDLVNSTVSLDRGVLDTVPVAHAAGARLYFIDDHQAFETLERISGETVNAKILPTAPLGKLDLADAAELTVSLTGRAQKPYAPGNVKLNGDAYPAAALSGAITVTWSHRDRLQQTASLVPQSAGNIGPESGVSYTVSLYDGATLKEQATGLTGTTHTFALFTLTDPRVELFAVRDGINSHQTHVIGFGWA